MLSLNTLVKRGLSLAALALLAFVTACTPNEPKPAGEIFDELFMESLRESPEYMAYLGMRERYDEWNDYSQASFDRSVAMSKDQLARLRAIDAEGLDKSEALSLTLYSQRLENGLADIQWRYHGYPVNQMFGVHSSIPSFLINQHLETHILQFHTMVFLK